MDGRRAVTRVDGVSGAASKNHVQASALRHASKHSCISCFWGFAAASVAVLALSHLPTATFKASPSETRPQGLQASGAASLGLRCLAERER